MQASCPDADPDLEPKPHAGVPESDCEPGSEEEEEADEEEMCAGSESDSSTDDSDDEPGDFPPPHGILFEPEYVDVSLVNREIAHMFTTGWEIGVIKGIEKDTGRHKAKAGQYIVKYKTERYPIWHELNEAQYGASSVWVIIKQ